MINDLVEVKSAHNIRLAEATAEIKKVSGAASAASNAAKKASQLAKETKDQLTQLASENQSWLGRADRQLDTLRTGLADSRRETDSRVGSVAVDLSTFQTKQTAVNANQDSVIALIRAKTGLTDERMKRLAAKLAEKERKEAKKKKKN